MKSIAIIGVSLALAASAFGQGQIRFQNRVTGVGGIFVPIHGVNPSSPGTRMTGNATTNGGAVNYTGVPLLAGTGFTGALWASPALGDGTATDMSTFEQLATAPFATATTLPGIIAGPTLAVTVPGATGAPNTFRSWNFQIRAWDNSGGSSTWLLALSNGKATGFSEVFTSSTALAPAAAGPLVGLTSFNLTLVPEPSVIALGALGLGALLLRRIRKQS